MGPTIRAREARALRAGLAAVWVVVLIGGAGCATTRTFDTSRLQETTAAELTADPGAVLAAVSPGGRPLLLKLAPGDSFPVQLAAHTPFAVVEDGAATLRFERDTWLYVAPVGMWLSPDGQRWAAIHDGKALKALFGAKDGYFRIGFGAREGSPPSVQVDVGLR